MILTAMGYRVLVFGVAFLAAGSIGFGVVTYRQAGRVGVSRVDGLLTIVLGVVLWPWTFALVLGVAPPRWVDVTVWAMAGVLLAVFTVRQVLWLRRSRVEHDQMMRQFDELLRRREQG